MFTTDKLYNDSYTTVKAKIRQQGDNQYYHTVLSFLRKDLKDDRVKNEYKTIIPDYWYNSPYFKPNGSFEGDLAIVYFDLISYIISKPEKISDGSGENGKAGFYEIDLSNWVTGKGYSYQAIRTIFKKLVKTGLIETDTFLRKGHRHLAVFICLEPCIKLHKCDNDFDRNRLKEKLEESRY